MNQCICVNPGEVHFGHGCRYGDEALLALLQEVRNHDARVADYQAKVFGGGCILAPGMSRTLIGQANAGFALEIMQRQQIQISAENIVGAGYRYLRCDLDSDPVWGASRSCSGQPPGAGESVCSNCANGDVAITGREDA